MSGLAACLINFVMFAYVPHMIPYVWAGAFLVAALLFASGGFRNWRRHGAALLLAGVVIGIVYRDTRVATAAIADTTYPGRRSEDGGSMALADFASHFFAASENARHYPPDLRNICEASGFLWLAPVTLLCFAAMRNLRREQRGRSC